MLFHIFSNKPLFHNAGHIVGSGYQSRLNTTGCPGNRLRGAQDKKKNIYPDLYWVISHRIHVCHIYGHIYRQYSPFMLAYIPYMDPMGIMIYCQYTHRI